MASSPQPANLTLEANLYLFHHIFLPPKLPQADDYSPSFEINILDYVVNALRAFGSHVPSQEATIFTTITTMISRLRDICTFPDGINEKELEKALKELDQQGEMSLMNFSCSLCLTKSQVVSYRSMCVSRMLES